MPPVQTFLASHFNVDAVADIFSQVQTPRTQPMAPTFPFQLHPPFAGHSFPPALHTNLSPSIKPLISIYFEREADRKRTQSQTQSLDLFPQAHVPQTCPPVIPDSPEAHPQPDLDKAISDPVEVAARVLSHPTPNSELNNCLKTFYDKTKSQRLKEKPLPPNASQKIIRKKKNCATSAASAAKKKFGVAVMEIMVTDLVSQLAALVKPAEEAGRIDLAEAAARHGGCTDVDRIERIRNKVEAEAEIARIQKVREKSSHPSSQECTSMEHFLDCPEEMYSVKSCQENARKQGGQVDSKGAKRKAQNCGTAHKNNRKTKGLFEEFWRETKDLLNLRDTIISVIGGSQVLEKGLAVEQGGNGGSSPAHGQWDIGEGGDAYVGSHSHLVPTAQVLFANAAPAC